MKVMISNNKLPENNTIEELLILRTALDQKDVWANLADQQKKVSKVFLFVTMLMWIGLAGMTLEMNLKSSQQIQQEWLFQASLFTTFVMGFYAQVSPTAKWKSLKTAERLIDSEIWKFRTRVGQYSILKQNSNTIVLNLRTFMSNLSLATLHKANLSESGLMNKQPDSYSTQFQYKQTLNESTQFEVQGKEEVQNLDDDMEPLSSALFKCSATQSSSQKLKLIDNHYSPVRPEVQIRIRLLTTQSFQQSRIEPQERAISTQTVLNICLGLLINLLAQQQQSLWVGLVTVVLGQVNYQREFNGFDVKLQRYSSAVNSLSDVSVWWMSLNSTEKKSLDQIESLVSNTEQVISEEQRKWASDSERPSNQQNNKSNNEKINEEVEKNNERNKIDIKN